MSNHTVLALALGLVAVLMISASRFPRMAYAQQQPPIILSSTGYYMVSSGVLPSELQNEEKQLQQQQHQIQAEVQKEITSNLRPIQVLHIQVGPANPKDERR
jgi:citrate lyase synthetase